MGWHTVSKGIIIGLIIGLIFGFTGGYYYKNLNAGAPLTNVTTGSDVFANTLMQNAVDRSIKEALNKHGLEAIFGSNNASSKTNRIKSTVLDQIGNLVGTAHAQGDEEGCTGSQFGLVTDIVKLDLDENIESSVGADQCVKSISFDGKLSFSLYMGVNSSGSIFNKIGYSLSGVMTQHVTVKPECKDVKYTYAINTGGTIYWDGTKIVSIFGLPGEPDDLPTNWSLICKGEIPFKWSWEDPGYNRERCCRAIPTETESTQ